MIGEAIHLRGLIESYWRGLDMFDQHSRFYFDDREELRRFCAGQVCQFLDTSREHLGNPRHLILKHPQLTVHFPLLFELVPKARFLVIVRDPRDTVASAVTSQRKGALEFGNSTPVDIAKKILTYLKPCVLCSNPGFKKNTLYVKYESLVRDPVAVSAIIQEFTGIKLDGFDPNVGSEDQEWLQQDSPFYSEHYGNAITDKRIGRYKDVLSKEDIQKIDEVCIPILDLLASVGPTFQAK